MPNPFGLPRHSLESASGGGGNGGCNGWSSNLRSWEDGSIEADMTDAEALDMVGGGVFVDE